MSLHRFNNSIRSSCTFVRIFRLLMASILLCLVQFHFFDMMWPINSTLFWLNSYLSRFNFKPAFLILFTTSFRFLSCSHWFLPKKNNIVHAIKNKDAIYAVQQLHISLWYISGAQFIPIGRRLHRYLQNGVRNEQFPCQTIC